jgi:hypothetical protein
MVRGRTFYLVVLSADELLRIGEVLEKVPVHGERYPAHLAARVGK